MKADDLIAPITTAAGFGLDLAMTDWRYRKQREQQQKLTADQVKASKEMAQFQNDLAFDMWQKTNYSAQRAELAYRDWETDRKSTRLNSSHITRSRMPSSA